MQEKGFQFFLDLLGTGTQLLHGAAAAAPGRSRLGVAAIMAHKPGIGAVEC